MLGDKAVQVVFQGPVVGGGDVVLELAVVLALARMAPLAVTGRGLEVDVVVVGVFVRAFVVQRQVDITLPHQVFDHGLGLHDLLDTCQFHRLGRLAISQHHLAIIGCLQGFGLFTGVGVLLDQQFLVAFQGFDLLPVHRDGACVGGLDQQLATVEDFDLAGEPVTVFQPDGIGEQGRGSTENSKAQQGSGQHKQVRGSG